MKCGLDASRRTSFWPKLQPPSILARCLRCERWVAVNALRTRPARYPPDRASIQISWRGKALRDRVVLRVIAIDRMIHFIIVTSLGVGAPAIAGSADTRSSRFSRVLATLQDGERGGAQNGQHVGFFHAPAPKMIGFLINLAVAAYLIVAKRMFGVRGGGKVDEDLRARDTSWQAIERATPPAFETAA